MLQGIPIILRIVYQARSQDLWIRFQDSWNLRFWAHGQNQLPPIRLGPEILDDQLLGSSEKSSKFQAHLQGIGSH